MTSTADTTEMAAVEGNGKVYIDRDDLVAWLLRQAIRNEANEAQAACIVELAKLLNDAW